MSILKEKAWVINPECLEEPWFADHSVHYGTRGQAKVKCLDYSGGYPHSTGEELTLMNIRVKRCKHKDLLTHEGVEILRCDLDSVMVQGLRRKKVIESDCNEYYVQDSRNYVGNAMLLWGKNSNGYVCSINEAHLFSKKEILDGFKWRDTDIIWKKSDLDNHLKTIVDSQSLDRNLGI